MSTLSENASAKFQSGFNCSQSVLHAACEKLSFDPNLALKLASGFGGGRQEICGALAGGIIALGIKYGRGENDGQGNTEATYAKIHELIDRFQKRHGGINCKDLLGGCDLQTDEGKQVFKERGLRQVTCACCIASAASILEDLL
jgi:C_GCAxxG_C_C family probable redox protein